MEPVEPTVADLRNSIRRRVERYIEETGISPSAFGVQVVNDCNLVRDLRADRGMTTRKLARIEAFLENRPAPD